jgi:hypothetical protein
MCLFVVFINHHDLLISDVPPFLSRNSIFIILLGGYYTKKQPKFKQNLFLSDTDTYGIN